MAKKKLAGVTAGSFDPAKTYQIELSRPVTAPSGTRPIHNPYVVTGAVAAAIADAIKADAVVEITD
jgi:uridylate kinase